ncbi:MAG: alpha-galactosidase [Thermoproteota archaeon]
MNGINFYPFLKFNNYIIEHNSADFDNFDILKVILSGENVTVEHYIAIKKEAPILITWVNVRPKSRAYLTDISPFCGFETFIFREGLQILSKEYWVLPGHYQYGLKDKMYSPILIRLSRTEISLDIVISSLTSNTGKFTFIYTPKNSSTVPGFYSLLSPDEVLVEEDHIFYSDKIIFLFGNNFNSLLTSYSSYVVAFNKALRSTNLSYYTTSRGWISWAYYYDKITPSSLEKEMSFIKDNLLNYGYKYVVIDDGWERRDTSYPAAFDWIQTKSSFGNLSRIISEAHKNNLRVVVWVAFTCYDYNSHLVKEKPNMFLMQGGRIFIENQHAYLNISSKEGRDYLEHLFSFYKSIGIDGLTFDLATLQFIAPTVSLSSPEKNITSVIVFNRFLEIVNELAEKYNLVIFLKGALEIPSLTKFSRLVSSRVSWDVTYSSSDTSYLRGVIDSILKTSFWLEPIIAPDPDALITGQYENLLSNVWNAIQTNSTVIYYGDPYSRANLTLLKDYMVWDSAASPIEFSWFEVPPTVSVAIKRLSSYETVYGLLLINCENNEKRILISLRSLINSSSPYIIFDPRSTNVFMLNESILSIDLDKFTSKLVYVIPFNSSRPTIVEITGFLNIESISYLPNSTELRAILWSSGNNNISIKIFFSKRAILDVYLNNKILSRSYYRIAKEMSIINLNLREGLNEIKIYFTASNVANYYSYEGDKMSKITSSLKKEYKDVMLNFLISSIFALLVALFMVSLSKDKNKS